MAGAGFHTAATHEEAWRWLTTEADFDIAFLQESIPPQWIMDGFPVVIHEPKYSQKGQLWGNTIISQQQTHTHFEFDGDHPWLAKIRGSVTVARPVAPDGLWLVNVHSNASPLSPSHSHQLLSMGIPHCHPEKLWEVEVASHFLRPTLEGKKFVFGGDLNSGYLFDTVNRYDYNKVLFINLRDQGLFDLRLAHSENEQQSYFKSGKGPFQLDHLFGDAKTARRTSKWEVLSHVARDLQLSDHAPLSIEIV